MDSFQFASTFYFIVVAMMMISSTIPTVTGVDDEEDNNLEFLSNFQSKKNCFDSVYALLSLNSTVRKSICTAFNEDKDISSNRDVHLVNLESTSKTPPIPAIICDPNNLAGMSFFVTYATSINKFFKLESTDKTPTSSPIIQHVFEVTDSKINNLIIFDDLESQVMHYFTADDFYSYYDNAMAFLSNFETDNEWHTLCRQFFNEFDTTVTEMKISDLLVTIHDGYPSVRIPVMHCPSSTGKDIAFYVAHYKRHIYFQVDPVDGIASYNLIYYYLE